MTIWYSQEVHDVANYTMLTCICVVMTLCIADVGITLVLSEAVVLDAGN